MRCNSNKRLFYRGSNRKFKLNNKFIIIQCSGNSMQPTLESEDVLLVNKFKKHLSNTNVLRGKMYIFVSPSDPNKLICKRVVALVRTGKNTNEYSIY